MRAIMGFNLEVARGPSIAIKPNEGLTVPAPASTWRSCWPTKPPTGPKWLKERADQH